MAEQVANDIRDAGGTAIALACDVSDEDAEKRFGGFERVLPYLRKTKMPTN